MNSWEREKKKQRNEKKESRMRNREGVKNLTELIRNGDWRKKQKNIDEFDKRTKDRKTENKLMKRFQIYEKKKKKREKGWMTQKENQMKEINGKQP